MKLATAMIYVKDLPSMTAFYNETVGLPVLTRSDTWVELNAGGSTLGLHAIPPHIAQDIETGPAREATPLKLLFAVSDIAAESARLRARGVTMIERCWGGLDIVDPEGNILGLVTQS